LGAEISLESNALSRKRACVLAVSAARRSAN
jgi:hypothetical protein